MNIVDDISGLDLIPRHFIAAFVLKNSSAHWDGLFRNKIHRPHPNNIRNWLQKSCTQSKPQKGTAYHERTRAKMSVRMKKYRFYKGTMGK